MHKIANWIDILSIKELPNNDVLSIMVAGRDIAIYTVDQEVFATNNTCSHGLARLSEGFLEGHVIECPMHQGKYDVRSGQPLSRPASKALTHYPVKIEAERVLIQID